MMYTLWKAGGFLLALILVQGCGTEENTESAASLIEADGGPCTGIEDCPVGVFACSNGRCQAWEPATCPADGLGAPCSFTSSLDGTEYAGLCTFDGRIGEYRCAPNCTDSPCPQPDSICHPVRPTGQPGDLKACMGPCEEDYQCLGGTWECNSIGECVVPNEAACVGKTTLDPCGFTGSDGTDYEGICSRPPPTVEGPPYYSETNLCVRVCDIDKPETCDRIKGVCQLAEPIGAGNGPGGIDYAVCVAPVCDEDRDCMGGMFGCEDQVCIPPSVTACAAKAAGEPCTQVVRGEERSGFCSSTGMCLPSCTPDENSFTGPGSCGSNPASSVCVKFVFEGDVARHMCIDFEMDEL